MATVRQIVGPVLTMLDETSPATTAEWARELLAMEGEDGTPERKIQRMYLKTILAICQFKLSRTHEARQLLNEAAEVAERLYPRLNVLLAWYKAHVNLMASMDAVGRGEEPEPIALAIGIEFMTVAKLAEKVHGNPLYAGLAYSLAAELVLRSGRKGHAKTLAERSNVQFGQVAGTDRRVEERRGINDAILSDTRITQLDPADFFTPGELQDTLPGD